MITKAFAGTPWAAEGRVKSQLIEHIVNATRSGIHHAWHAARCAPHRDAEVPGGGLPEAGGVVPACQELRRHTQLARGLARTYRLES